MFELLRWLCGGILILSGLLKLGRTDQLHLSLWEMGFSARFVQHPLVAKFLVRFFPLIEIIVGIGVITVPSPFFPLSSFALFGVFLFAVIRSVATGREATCDCFGGYGSSAVTKKTIARNVLLITLAGFAVFSFDAPFQTLSSRWGVFVALASVALPIMVGLIMIVLRPKAEKRKKERTADKLLLHNAEGQRIAFREFLDPPTYLVFFSPSCLACRKMVERFRWWPNALSDGYDLQPIFLGHPKSFTGIEAYTPLVDHAWYDHDKSVGKAVGLAGTPGTVRVSTAHPLGEGWVRGATASEKYVVRPGFFEELHSHSSDHETAQEAAEDSHP